MVATCDRGGDVRVGGRGSARSGDTQCAVARGVESSAAGGGADGPSRRGFPPEMLEGLKGVEGITPEMIEAMKNGEPPSPEVREKLRELMRERMGGAGAGGGAERRE